MTYGFQFPYVSIPYYTVYKKEVMIVIAPRQKYAPDIDALSNTQGLVDQPIKRISWNEMESGEKKEELECVCTASCF